LVAVTFGAGLRLGGLAIEDGTKNCWFGFGWFTFDDLVEIEAWVGRWWGSAAVRHIVYYLYQLSE